jgi:hypothetical protein
VAKSSAAKAPTGNDLRLQGSVGAPPSVHLAAHSGTIDQQRCFAAGIENSRIFSSRNRTLEVSTVFRAQNIYKPYRDYQ